MAAPISSNWLNAVDINPAAALALRGHLQGVPYARPVAGVSGSLETVPRTKTDRDAAQQNASGLSLGGAVALSRQRKTFLDLGVNRDSVIAIIPRFKPLTAPGSDQPHRAIARCAHFSSRSAHRPGRSPPPDASGWVFHGAAPMQLRLQAVFEPCKITVMRFRSSALLLLVGAGGGDLRPAVSVRRAWPRRLPADLIEAVEESSRQAVLNRDRTSCRV